MAQPIVRPGLGPLGKIVLILFFIVFAFMPLLEIAFAGVGDTALRVIAALEALLLVTGY